MHDIHHDFPIASPAEKVFDALCSTDGLAAWWTETTQGAPGLGQSYRLGFGPGYQWTGVVRRFEPSRLVEWEMTAADDDWRGTRVGFRLTPRGEATDVEFWHSGWPDRNAHYRRSSFCWAMYLRLLRRFIERAEVVPYPQRLGA
jgi:uncharacterized protein YndB with AHSA1/START domain